MQPHERPRNKYSLAAVIQPFESADVNVEVYINQTDINSNLTLAIYSDGHLISTKTFSLGDIADPYVPVSELNQYGAIGLTMDTGMAAGATATIGLYADGPVYIGTSNSSQLPHAYVSTGILASTLPTARTSLAFALVAWGGD